MDWVQNRAGLRQIWMDLVGLGQRWVGLGVDWAEDRVESGRMGSCIGSVWIGARVRFRWIRTYRIELDLVGLGRTGSRITPDWGGSGSVGIRSNWGGLGRIWMHWVKDRVGLGSIASRIRSVLAQAGGKFRIFGHAS